MTVNAANAAAAYGTTARAPVAGIELSGPIGPSFSNQMEAAAQSALEAGHNAERVSMRAVNGQADLSEVVTAVANAEVTLQSVVAVRDRVVNAYQEIMRMPI